VLVADPLGEVGHVGVPDRRRQWVDSDEVRVLQLVVVDEILPVQTGVRGLDVQFSGGWVEHPLVHVVGLVGQSLSDLVGKRRITADTALRLSRCFGTTDRFWLNLQTRFDLETEKDRLGTALDDIRPLQSA
jgi:addiction module HigA family antidote